MNLLKVLKVENCSASLDELISLLQTSEQVIIVNPEMSPRHSNSLVEICNPESDIFSCISTYPDFNSLIYPKHSFDQLSNSAKSAVLRNKGNFKDALLNISPYALDGSSVWNLIHSPIDYSKFKNSVDHFQVYSNSDLHCELRRIGFNLQAQDLILVFDQVINRLVLTLNHRPVDLSIFDCIFFHNEGSRNRQCS